jgi:HSP20 family molecular chaperone IbpA
VPQSGLSDLSPQSDKFQVMVDVSHFTPEEITVKTVDNTIVVSAKHEDRADDYGFVSRQFSRKYLIPQDIDPLSITSTLSPEGILTIQVLMTY